MLIEQIIEFRLRGLLTVNVLLQLVIFMSKQKSLRKIFEWIIYYKNTYKNLTPNCKITSVFSTKL